MPTTMEFKAGRIITAAENTYKQMVAGNRDAQRVRALKVMAQEAIAMAFGDPETRLSVDLDDLAMIVNEYEKLPHEEPSDAPLIEGPGIEVDQHVSRSTSTIPTAAPIDEQAV